MRLANYWHLWSLLRGLNDPPPSAPPIRLTLLLVRLRPHHARARMAHRLRPGDRCPLARRLPRLGRRWLPGVPVPRVPFPAAHRPRGSRAAGGGGRLRRRRAADDTRDMGRIAP